MGAFGAHALAPALDPRATAIYQTAAQYQMYHALTLVAVGGLAGRLSHRRAGSVKFAGWAFTAGIVLFSGSLYALALTGIRAFGAITPFGGLAFLAGWLALARAAFGRSS